jgi:hypothetical protein
MRRRISKSFRAMYAKQVNYFQMKRREFDVHKSKKFTNIFCNHDDCRKKNASEKYEQTNQNEKSYFSNAII